jgi:hypothetical protein
MTNDPIKSVRDSYDRGDIDYTNLRRVHLRRTPGAGARSTFAVRLEGEVIEQLRRVAADHGIGPTQLVREWILERLDAESQTSAPAQRVALSEADLATLRPLIQEIVADELRAPAKQPPARTTETATRKTARKRAAGV